MPRGVERLLLLLIEGLVSRRGNVFLLVHFNDVLGGLMWLTEVDSNLVLACVDHMTATQVLDIPSPGFELRVMVILLLDGALGGA